MRRFEVSRVSTYVVQRTPRLSNLNDLNARIRALGQAQGFRYGHGWEAESPVSGLVETFDERDVEDGGVVTTQTQIDVRKSPQMMNVQEQGAALQRPFRAIVVGFGLVHICACGRDRTS